MTKIVKVGRRKTSVARVFIQPSGNPGKGTILINERPFENYFPLDYVRESILEPFTVLGLAQADFDVTVNLDGGGNTGQAGALRMGIARALVKMNEENKPMLRSKGLLTRDSRMVERKKYGRPKARKRFQFSKR